MGDRDLGANRADTDPPVHAPLFGSCSFVWFNIFLLALRSTHISTLSLRSTRFLGALLYRRLRSASVRIIRLLTLGSPSDSSSRPTRPAMHECGIFTSTPTLSRNRQSSLQRGFDSLGIQYHWAFDTGGHLITVLALRFGFADPAVFQIHFLRPPTAAGLPNPAGEAGGDGWGGVNKLGVKNAVVLVVLNHEIRV